MREVVGEGGTMKHEPVYVEGRCSCDWMPVGLTPDDPLERWDTAVDWHLKNVAAAALMVSAWRITHPHLDYSDFSDLT